MLEVRDLRRLFVVHHNPLARYRHPDHVITAVDGVSFSVAEGEVFGIVGESGSGKTTLARALLRLVEPTGGGVFYRGRDVFAMDAAELRRFRREVQPVFQDADSTLDPRQHVDDILEEPLLIHGRGDAASRRDLIAAVLEQVNLPSSFMQRHPSELSGGQRRRVALARALLLDPEMLVADEPTSGLDPLVSTQILSLLLRLKQERGLTLVLISHDLATVSYAADRIAVMYHGRFVEQAPGQGFEQEVQHPYTRFLFGLERRLPETALLEGLHEHLHDSEEGCSYLHSCPHHLHECHHVAPPLRELSTGHFVACHALAWNAPAA
jgi:oligopeptide/dipeptide ABC transporter ATP-binding protein